MNTFGRHISLTVAGESHSEALTLIIDGLDAGTPIDLAYIRHVLSLRAPGRALTSARHEADEPILYSGVKDGHSVGGVLCIGIRNTDARPSDYAALHNMPRPSHADYPAAVKYGSFAELSGGGAFSGRLTALYCIAGAIAEQELARRYKLRVSTHLLSVGACEDTAFDPVDNEAALTKRLNDSLFPVINEEAGEKMKTLIESIRNDGDSIGGLIEGKIAPIEENGILPVGVGEPPFYGVENAISSMLYAIPAVKGVSFGSGFDIASLRGTQANDAYYYDENNTIRTRTNHNGGILGGLTTGMPILFRAAVKPTPSIAAEQETVDLTNGKSASISVGGRHDPCIAVRACAAVRCAAAFAMLDLLYGERKNCQ